MTQSNQTPPAAGAGATKELTAAEAAKRVMRTVTERVKTGKDAQGADTFKDVTKKMPIAASEVFAFKDYGTHVVVVTRDGQKFSSKDEG